MIIATDLGVGFTKLSTNTSSPYQWYRSTTPDFAINDANKITGATNSLILVPNLAEITPVYYATSNGDYLAIDTPQGTITPLGNGTALSLNAADFGLTQNTPDAGVVLNDMFAAANSQWGTQSVLTIPAGTYNISTPLDWSSKRITLHADNVVLNWTGNDATILTIGGTYWHADTGNRVQLCHIQGLTINAVGKNVTGIKFQNINNSTLDNISINNCTTALWHYADCNVGLIVCPNNTTQYYYSYFINLRNININNCDIGILQSGFMAHDLLGSGYSNSQATNLRCSNITANCNDTFLRTTSGGNHFLNCSVIAPNIVTSVNANMLVLNNAKGRLSWKNNNNMLLTSMDISSIFITNKEGQNSDLPLIVEDLAVGNVIVYGV
jgi:hypothetical protein